MSTTEVGTTQVPSPPPVAEPRWAPRQVIMLSLAAFLLLGAVGSAAIANRLAGFDEDRREGDHLRVGVSAGEKASEFAFRRRR